MLKAIFRALPALFLFSCSSIKEPVIKIQTPKGDIWFRFYPGTPEHKKAFIRLAKDHYWDSLCFNRVIPDFVAQAGCPDTQEGFGNSPYLLDPEFRDSLRHTYGAVGAGRDDNPQKKSAACQFYIVQNRQGLQRLDGRYTVFGKVIRGMEVVDSICLGPRDKMDAPLKRIPTKISVLYLSKSGVREITGGEK